MGTLIGGIILFLVYSVVFGSIGIGEILAVKGTVNQPSRLPEVFFEKAH